MFLQYGANVFANKFQDSMLSLYPYGDYSSFEDPGSFVREMDAVVNNLVDLSGKLVASINAELEEASNYDLQSANETSNLNAAEVINKMLARQVVTDLLVYKFSYLHEMYKNASVKLKKMPETNPLFDDMPFDPPLTRMVIYEWVRNMVKTFNEAAMVEDKLSRTWTEIRDEINSNPKEPSKY
ncbi:conserved hypothetical protein [Theileria equi strain WA]|uniref:Uncharacterized protein n=1 Tax=Theileria equi strain WA TaxID=1537102 RepID=L1LG14_THEEQ|nr:conserved hypothetical protein [Theileria equi strain WA]EKX74281.1 conserved hypothetical protein [Theileria equi strain WA]|eukprot:XP_004833733.1 conserved hypothetical protein [Theileria equi strain WA]